MSAASSALRIVRDDEADFAPAASPAAPPYAEPLAAELARLRREIELLRRRDEVIYDHMHRLDEEMRLAARLQRDFLPKALPQVGRARFHALYRPAGYVSGDLYDVSRLDEHRVGFYVADAVGHGIPAALLAMFMKTVLMMKEIVGDSYRLLAPSQSVARLNAAMLEQQLANTTFATALVGQIDVRDLRLTFARGGHPNPILLRRNGRVELPSADGCLLGVFPEESFADGEVLMRAGDRMFVFTDGMEVSLPGNRPADIERICGALAQRAELATPALLEDLSMEFDRAGSSLQPQDDVTLIVVEVAEDEAAEAA